MPRIRMSKKAWVRNHCTYKMGKEKVYIVSDPVWLRLRYIHKVQSISFFFWKHATREPLWWILLQSQSVNRSMLNLCQVSKLNAANETWMVWIELLNWDLLARSNWGQTATAVALPFRKQFRHQTTKQYNVDRLTLARLPGLVCKTRMFTSQIQHARRVYIVNTNACDK